MRIIAAGGAKKIIGSYLLRLQFTRRCAGRDPARACRARADKELENAGMLLRQR
jgi:hypothetical protein